MRKTIKKAFFIWDFDKEEQWLNEMSAKGLALVSVGFCRYEFEDCLPGEYQICLQLLENSPQNEESRKYMEFIEETGAEHVGTYLKWVYFRRRSSEGKFEIFSDNESRIKHLSRIISFILILLPMNLYNCFYNFFIGISSTSIINIMCGCLILVLLIFLFFGMLRLMKKRKKLKDRSVLFE